MPEAALPFPSYSADHLHPLHDYLSKIDWPKFSIVPCLAAVVDLQSAVALPRRCQDTSNSCAGSFPRRQCLKSTSREEAFW
jgi:hypothetical protein